MIMQLTAPTQEKSHNINQYSSVWGYYGGDNLFYIHKVSLHNDLLLLYTDYDGEPCLIHIDKQTSYEEILKKEFETQEVEIKGNNLDSTVRIDLQISNK